VTNQRVEAKTDGVESIEPDLQLLYDHIKLTFIANARKIAEGQKPETLLKMIQSCKEIQPVDSSQKELWQIVQKVRHELLVGKSSAQKKSDTPTRRRPRNKNDHR
jgi:hypothetical protein